MKYSRWLTIHHTRHGFPCAMMMILLPAVVDHWSTSLKDYRYLYHTFSPVFFFSNYKNTDVSYTFFSFSNQFSLLSCLTQNRKFPQFIFVSCFFLIFFLLFAEQNNGKNTDVIIELNELNHHRTSTTHRMFSPFDS